MLGGLLCGGRSGQSLRWTACILRKGVQVAPFLQANHRFVATNSKTVLRGSCARFDEAITRLSTEGQGISGRGRMARHIAGAHPEACEVWPRCLVGVYATGVSSGRPVPSKQSCTSVKSSALWIAACQYCISCDAHSGDGSGLAQYLRRTR